MAKSDEEEFPLAPLDEPPKPAKQPGKPGDTKRPTPAAKAPTQPGPNAPQPDDEFALAPPDAGPPPKTPAEKKTAGSSRPPASDEFALSRLPEGPGAGKRPQQTGAPAQPLADEVAISPAADQPPGQKPAAARKAADQPAQAKSPLTKAPPDKLPQRAAGPPASVKQPAAKMPPATQPVSSLQPPASSLQPPVSSLQAPATKALANQAGTGSAAVPAGTVHQELRGGQAGLTASSRRLSWPRLVGAAATLVALSLAAIGAWRVWNLPTADELLLSAQRDYEAGGFAEAAAKFDTFLASYPNHARSDAARAKRGFARLRPLVDAGGDWPLALETARAVAAETATSIQHEDDRRALAEILAQIAAGLVHQAQRAAAQQPNGAPGGALLDQARDAIALSKKYLPRRLQANSTLAQAEFALGRLEHSQDRPQELTLTIGKVKAAASGPGIAAAYQARRDLLRRYPELATEPALNEAMSQAAKAELRRVTYGTLDQPGIAHDMESPVSASFTFARCTGPAATSPPREVAYVASAEDGSIYALDAATGRLLWRRFVGFDTLLAPIPVGDSPADDALLVDSVHSRMVRVDAITGRVVWCSPLAPFDAQPVVAGDRVLVACRGGDLVAIDLATGTAEAKFTLPQPLAIAPAFHPQERIYYQIADHSCLYVLSEADRRPQAVVYLGHERGSIVAPPVLLGRYLLVVENDGLRHAALHVLDTRSKGGQPQPVDKLELAGQVVLPPLVHGDHVYIAAVGGGLYTFRMDTANREEPLAAGPSSPGGEGPAVLGHLSIIDGQLWVAGAGLARYELPPQGDRFVPRQVLFEGDIFTQSVTAAGGVLVHVRASAAWDGLTVAAVAGSSGAGMWTTYLGAPLVPPVVDEATGKVTLVHRMGALFELPLGELQGDGVRDEPISSVEWNQALPADTRAIVWDDGLVALAPGAGSDQLLVLNRAGQPPKLLPLVLPSAVSCRPVRFGLHLLVPLAQGQVYLLDPRSGRPAAEPFQPRLEPGRLPRWEGATTSGDGSAMISDGWGTIYSLTLQSGPQPKLLGKIAGSPEGQLIPPLPAPGNVLWGPVSLGSHTLVATDAGELWCVAGGSEPKLAWKVPLTHGLPVGVVRDEPRRDRWVFASATGTVWAVEAETAKEAWVAQTGQPLIGEPVVTQDGYLLSGRGGTLYLLAKAKTP